MVFPACHSECRENPSMSTVCKRSEGTLSLSARSLSIRLQFIIEINPDMPQDKLVTIGWP